MLKMDREELANKAYKIMYFDFAGTKSEKEIWKAIAETDDDALYQFVSERYMNE